MKSIRALRRVFSISVLLTLFISTSAFADNLMITRYFSGIWDQPDQQSQGIILQIGEQEGDEKVGIAYWFTYGEDLQTTWYLGVGPINGNEINMTLYTAFNVGFMEGNIEGNANVEEVGTLDLIFRNCNQGEAVFDTSEDVIGSGEFRIKRINSIYRSRCSGGVSDDTPSDARPLQLEARLMSARDNVTGGGKAKFWERTDRSDFKVEVEEAPDGTYALQVCEADQGEMEVAGGEGEMTFRSPANDSTQLLDFDPRDCLITLSDGEGIAFTTGDAVLAEKQTGKKDKEDSDGLKIKVDLNNTGEIEGAEGEVEFEVEGDETEFEVEVENLPVGLYSVIVAAVKVGDLDVTEEDGKTKGKLKIENPDFDPRGQIIEVIQDPTVFLEVLFPDE